MKHPKKLVTFAAASMMLFTACGSDVAPAEAVTASTVAGLYEAAKSEGRVTVYGPTEDLYGAVYEDFKKDYPGIELVTSDIFGQELDSRLEGEQVAGGFDADLVHIGVSDVERYNAKAYLTAYEPVEADALDRAYIGPDSMWSVPSQHLYATAYNTDVLSAEEMPATWDELAGSDFAGRVATSNPKQSGVVPQVISAAMAAETIDTEWVESFKADTNPKIYPSVANALQATVTGETAISFVAGYGSYMRQAAQGAPLGFVAMDDGAFFSDVAYGVLDGAPHPNAARLLVAWMFSDAGQASLAEHVFEFGTMPDAPKPEGAEELGDPVRLVYPGGEKYRSTLELLNTTF